MIKYQLSCDSAHEFEGWFGNISDYDTQSARGLLACPVCGSATIEKRPMAPAVVSRAAAPGDQPAVSAPASSSGVRALELMDQLRSFRRTVVANSEDVGASFADEARRMHSGEIEERNIHGRMTSSEASALADEDIPFGVLPPLPEDGN